jgi:hypothetical protein
MRDLPLCNHAMLCKSDTFFPSQLLIHIIIVKIFQSLKSAIGSILLVISHLLLLVQNFYF